MTAGMIPLDLGAMLRGGDPEAQQRQLDEQQDARRNKWPAAQARQMLRDALAVLQQEHEFKCGDMVRYKRGLENNCQAPCGDVAVFIRATTAQDLVRLKRTGSGLPLATIQPDCVIGVLLMSGAMAEYLSCSRYLEPAPEPEQ